MINYNLRIPLKEKHKFSEPLDKLIAGTRQETISKVEKIIKSYQESKFMINLYLVGDIVTKDFLANSFLRNFIRLCIIDEKTKRTQNVLGEEQFFDEIIEFENEESTIQKGIWSLIEKILKNKKKKLLKIVKGEEDLLVLPLILKIPLDKNSKQLVFYGQPPITDAKKTIPEGIVIIDVNNKIQKKVEKFINLMEKY